MIKHIKQLFSDSVVYGLAGVISTFISLFLVPLYTRVFTPSDYGVISILTTTSVFLNIILIFSLDNSAAVLYWDRPDRRERVVTFNSWFWTLLFMGGVFMIIVLFLSRPLSNLLFSSANYTQYFLLMGVNLLFVGFQKITNIWCRLQKQPVKAMVFSIAVLLVTVGLNIIFILALRMGVIGVFYSQLLASFAGFGIMIFMFRQWISFRFFSVGRLKEMVRISFPLVPASILYWLMNMASVYFLRMYVNNTAEIGLYQVGASVANILSLCTWAFFQAWAPFSLEISKRPEAQKLYSFIFEFYCVAGFFLAFALMLIGEDLLRIFTHSNYLGAATVLGLLGINVIIIGIPNILAIANNLVKRNIPYAMGIFLGAIVTVFLFIVLIPGYKKEGAAIAMIVGNLIVTVYMGFRAQKLYYIPYDFMRVSLIIILQLVLFFMAAQLTGTFVMHILACLLIGFILVMIYYIGKNHAVVKEIFTK